MSPYHPAAMEACGQLPILTCIMAVYSTDRQTYREVKVVKAVTCNAFRCQPVN